MRDSRWSAALRGLLVPATVVAGLGACGTGAEEGGRGSGQVEVVAAFAPLAEAAQRVGADRVAVRDLTPAGTEPHDLELTPQDVDRILDADLVVVLGGDFQPAVEDAVELRDGPALVVLDVLELADTADDAGNAGDGDPHVWLDPTLLARVADAIAEALTDVDGSGASEYRANAQRYAGGLEALDAEMAESLADCESRLLVTAHDAFRWLARRYDLAPVGIAGISPDAEPDPRGLAELADLAEEKGVTTVFTETLVSPEIAETVAREAGGLRTAVLDPFEGLTDERRDAGADYSSVMRENLAALREGLGCR